MGKPKLIAVVVSALLLSVSVLVYLVFIRHDIYFFSAHSRYKLLLDRAKVAEFNQIIKSSPNFGGNILVIVSGEAKETSRWYGLSSPGANGPDRFPKLYFTEWGTIGPAVVLYVYVSDVVFATAQSSGQVYDDPNFILSNLLSVEFFKKFGLSPDQSRQIRSLFLLNDIPDGYIIGLGRK